MAVAYDLMRRVYRDDPTQLRNLYDMVGDRAAVAALDREIMGQAGGVPVGDIPVRGRADG